MPVIPSAFRPAFGLGNGHVQTILGALRPRRVALRYKRERLELADGDFLDLDWAQAGKNRLAILSHGLEGNSRDMSTRSMAAALQAAGWDVLAWNFRGCSGEANRLLRSYHSGETEDLRAVIAHAAQRYQKIALLGFSLGGNVTLKYLGESPPHPAVVAAAALSVPVDLASSAAKLDRHRWNGIYLRRFMKRLKAKIAAKAAAFPDLEVANLDAVATFQEFDERFTARLHGFQNAEDYWARSSARQFLPAITVPTLLLNARNDPFLTKKSFPFAEAQSNDALFLEVPNSGGHLGFVDMRGGWLERRVTDFWRDVVG